MPMRKNRTEFSEKIRQYVYAPQ